MSAPVLARTSTGSVRFPRRRVSGFEAVADVMFSRLRTLRGTALEETERGIPWIAWAERPAIPMVEIEAAVRAQLEVIPGVVVRSVTAQRVNRRVVCSVEADVRTSDGIAVLTVTVADPYLTAGAPPWFAVAPLSFGALLG
jgi:hypothetical protein